jgi:hypothetical protein
MLSGGMHLNFSASAARLRNVGTSSRARERSSAPFAVNAVALPDIRSFVQISLLRGLGFVYFKGSENVNLFVEADLRWTYSLELRIYRAEKDLGLEKRRSLKTVPVTI